MSSRPASVFVLAAMSAALWVSAAPAAAETTDTLAFEPAADAFVSAAHRRMNFGGARKLRVDRSPIARTYLRFDVRGLTGEVARATLRIYALGGSRRGYRVRAASNLWRERRITFANAPSFRRAVASSGGFGRRHWTSVDVTSLVRHEGRFTFVLTTRDRTGFALASREQGKRGLLQITTRKDRSAPQAPRNLRVTETSQTQVSVAWDAAHDNLAVDGYRVYADGTEVATTHSTSYTVSELACGTEHSLAVEAFDAAGNVSRRSDASAFTAACPSAADTTPPSVTVTSPSAAATVSGAIALAAAATDDVGVTQVKWYVDSAEVASDENGAPWQATWTSATVADGSHQIFAKAADAAGNWGASPTTTFTVENATTGTGPCGTASAPPAVWQHVVWIVMENKTYSQVIGSSNAPYINSIARKCGLATQFFAEAHPSLPNYIAMTSGSTQGITDDSDPSAHPLSVASIFSQVGGDWRALEESMPSNCDLFNSGLYAVRHNPAAYYTNIRTECASRDVPLADPPDLSARFTFITPNLCNDMHSCPSASTIDAEVRNGDAWLSTWLPKILATPEYASGSTAVFVTWDEDDFNDAQHIPTLVISPSVPSGTSSSATFNHYSLLRTTEEMLATDTFLGNAASADSMRSAFGL